MMPPEVGAGQSLVEVEDVLGRLPLPSNFEGVIHDYQLHGRESFPHRDPVWRPEPGLITRSTRVASIGSCFSGNLKRWLINHGYSYIESETGPQTTNGSARFGQVYDPRSMRQIFEFAYGLFQPVERWWRYGGRLVDPYRSRLSWPNEAAAEGERRAHAAAVREVVETAEVLIATLGLAETWRNREDGATFWRLPLEYDAARHEFHMLSVSECVDDLERMYALVREKNPSLRLMLTLSPVPLNQTFRPMSLLAADSASKATLRIAIDEFTRRHDEVIYFPSFELIRELDPDPWEPDWRHIRERSIDRVMRLFMRHYGDATECAENAERL